MNYDVDQMLQVNAEAYNKERDISISVERLGRGMKSIYMLSLLEAYVMDENSLSSIILVEEPEMFLHPQLQKTASEILYRLAQKNQVIFTTHSPHLLANFSSRQLCQIILDEDSYSVAKKKTNISSVLDDLGYNASDLMNVDFVFIVEGKQDKYRLPLLLNHYYSEIYDEDGRLNRVAILTTNSCTNIKTYANLKYINQLYMKDRFLMIRDSDGKDRDMLGRALFQGGGESSRRYRQSVPVQCGSVYHQQTYIPVDAAVEGEVCFLGVNAVVDAVVHPHRELVLCLQQLRDLCPEGGVAAVMGAKLLTVQQHGGAGVDALKLQPYLLLCRVVHRCCKAGAVGAAAPPVIVPAVLTVPGVPCMGQLYGGGNAVRAGELPVLHELCNTTHPIPPVFAVVQ